MLFTEFNMEDALEVRGEEKYAEGLEKGIFAVIDLCNQMQMSPLETSIYLQKKFNISSKQADNHLMKFEKFSK